MPTPSDNSSAQYGVFFDGTGNNYYVDSKFDDDVYEPTNIAKLFELYQPSQSSRVGKQYVNGIGTRDTELKDSGDDAKYSSLEMAFGIGIQDRIDEAAKGIQSFLQPFNDVKTLQLDIFGFSRGAATARIMVNQVHQLSKDKPDTWGGVTVTIRFLGIFDTVGSIGVKGDGDNAGYNLNIHPDAVTQVCHLTAHNEHRKYFPLSTLYDANGSLPANCFEKTLLGAHSDVGGGYGDNENQIYLAGKYILYGGKAEKVEQQRQERSDKQQAEWLAHWKDYLKGKWKTDDGEVKVEPRPPQKNGPEGQPNSHKQYLRYIWHRTVDKRLSHLALHLMLQKSSALSLPFAKLETLSDLAKPLGFDIAPALQDYWQAIESGDDLFVEQYLQLYPEFIHHSHQFEPPKGGLGIVNANASEDLKRQILYNEPMSGETS